MNHTYVLLSALLLPAIIYGKNNDTYIKELEEVQFKKELEISELGKMIAERNNDLSSFEEIGQNILEYLLAKKIAKLEMSGIKLKKNEIDQLAVDLRSSANKFVSDFFVAYEKNENIEIILQKGLLNDENLKILKELESLNFFLVRSAFERILTQKLVKKYAMCIQELSLINQKIEQLNK